MAKKRLDSSPLLKSIRADLASVLADPQHQTAPALLGAVRAALRRLDASTPQCDLATELLGLLRRAPQSSDDLALALAHRRRADVVRTLNRLRDEGRVVRAEWPDHRWSQKNDSTPLRAPGA